MLMSQNMSFAIRVVAAELGRVARQVVNEPVSVILVSSAETNSVRPYKFKWRGTDYKITYVARHVQEYQGEKLFHVFSVTDGHSVFRLKLDAQTLAWTLAAMDSG
jgi:hypothetical protein